MTGRGSRGKPRAPRRVAPPDEATTTMSPEQLESLRDESERPTLRMPTRPPLAPSDEAPGVREEVTVQARVMEGPDGVARVVDVDELDDETIPRVPSKVLLGKGKTRKKRG